MLILMLIVIVMLAIVILHCGGEEDVNLYSLPPQWTLHRGGTTGMGKQSSRHSQFEKAAPKHTPKGKER